VTRHRSPGAVAPRSRQESAKAAGQAHGYTLWDDRMHGTNTQHPQLGPQQIAELTALRERLVE
jgi:hypothetical protein